jgi:hypothetical protein
MRSMALAFLLLSATGTTAAAAPLFVEQTSRLGPQPCGPDADLGCYTNYAILADLDGDGALDVVFPNAKGFYTQSQPAEPLVILKNDGTANFTDVSAAAVGGYTGWLREVTIGDIDGDGDLDIVAPDAWGGNALLFINDGHAQFTDEAASRWNVQTRAGSVRLADVDGDGHLDILVGDWGSNPNPASPSASSVHLWLNDGAGHFTDANDHLPSAQFADGSATPIDLDVFDANGDFALDLLVNARNGNVQLWLNDGSGHFSDATLTFPKQPGPYHYNPGVCDIDNDGDLDVWIDNGHAVAFPQLLVNDGQGHFTDETGTRVDPAVQGQDDNGDGCFDAVDLSLSDGSSAAKNERVLKNDGTGHFTLMAESFPLVGDSTLGMDFGDLDGDGRIDAVTGQGESGSFINRLYLATGAVAADTRAPVFRAVESTPAIVTTSATPVVHVAISDESTTDVGPRLGAAYVEWTGSGAAQDVALTFVGGDLFRAVLPARGAPGSVSWRACASDRAGNSGCSPPKTYEASEGNVNPGTGGTPSGQTVNPGTGGKKHGCSCDVVASRSAALPSAVIGALLLALRRRRRRRATGCGSP